MTRFTLTASVVLLSSQSAFAGGLDRSGQPLGLLFEQGNYAEFSFSSTSPSVSGTGVGIAPSIAAGTPYSSVGKNFTTMNGGLKFNLSEKASVALLFDQPYGVDIAYTGSPGLTELGGTAATASSSSVSVVGRYRFNEKFSVHGGIRHQSIKGDITLSGRAYGPINGYNVALGSDDAVGFLIGGAFELPQYAARIAVTYNSEIVHKLPTVETFGFGAVSFGASGDTEIKSPASINIDFQTGLNQKTLLFGSMRYAKWSDLKISPQFFDDAATDGVINGVGSGASISDLEDSFSYTLGIGRKITDNFSASAVIGYEPTGSDDLVSPLSPTNGNWSIGLGGRYSIDDVTVSGGVRYTMLGDARPETGTPDVARASFTGNSALSVGFKIGFSF